MLQSTFNGFPDSSVVKNPPAIQETQESWVRFLGWEDPLEKEMAAHSSILAWKMLWTWEPGGYSPQGSKESDTTEATQQQQDFQLVVFRINCGAITVLGFLSGSVVKNLPAMQNLQETWV